MTTGLHPGHSTDQGGIKCQQISGGDGYATMADGTQTYLFAFGPLSGLNDIAKGLPGTQRASVFLTPYDPTSAAGSDASNGAVGLVPDPDGSGGYTGHVDPRQIMDVGVMNGNMPAPMMAIDEDDEFFLTLSNVGMIMRPDLFEQHTVHFHGYPNASSFMTVCRMHQSPSILGEASLTTTWRPMRELISGIAISHRPNTCRWAWLDSSMCGRARID